jgi:hypothetical protein
LRQPLGWRFPFEIYQSVQSLNIVSIMEKNVFGAQMEIDESTGMRVLSFVGLMNGIIVNPADLGDNDALRELQDN